MSINETAPYTGFNDSSHFSSHSNNDSSHSIQTQPSPIANHPSYIAINKDTDDIQPINTSKIENYGLLYSTRIPQSSTSRNNAILDQISTDDEYSSSYYSEQEKKYNSNKIIMKDIQEYLKVPKIPSLITDSALPMNRQYTALTPRGLFIFFGSKISPGGIKSSVFTIVISTVGAGCLSLPYGVRVIGLIPGLFLLTFAAFLSYFSLDLLLIAIDFIPTHAKISYRSLAIYAYGDSMAMFVQLTLLVQFLGAALSYIVAFSGLLDLVYSLYFPGSIYIWLAIGITSLIVIPLSFMRSMAALRFTSLMGFSFSLYFAIVLFIEYFILCSYENIRNVADIDIRSTCFWSPEFHLNWEFLVPFQSWNRTWTGFLTSFPLNIFAYTCHPYMFPVYLELRRRSRRRMRKVLSRAMGFAAMVYLMVGTCGFLLFLNETCGNILTNNFHEHVDVIVAALGISMSCILTQPIYAFAFRSAIAQLFWGIKQLPTIKHLTVTIVFWILCVSISLTVTDIAVVFGVLGSTTYPLLGYILPGIFFRKMVPREEYPVRYQLALIQAVFVGCVSFASLIYKVSGYIQGSSDMECDNMQSVTT